MQFVDAQNVVNGADLFADIFNGDLGGCSLEQDRGRGLDY